MLNELELEILRLLLAGDHPVLECLRRQLALAAVDRREMSGVGFFTHLRLPRDVGRLPEQRNMDISDVYAEVVGLEHPAGFVLFVTDGAMDTLESFIVDDGWPESASIRRAFYVHHPRPDTGELVETEERDLNFALPNQALQTDGRVGRSAPSRVRR